MALALMAGLVVGWPQRAGTAASDGQLVGHWALDEGKGNTAHDRSSRKNHGTVARPDWRRGAFGCALHLNGKASSCVAIPDSPSLRFGKSDFTIQCWIKPDSLDQHRWIIEKRDASKTWWNLQLTTSGRITLVLADESSTRVAHDSQRAVRPGEWTHVAVTVDRGACEIRLYLDGQLDSEEGVSPANLSRALDVAGKAIHLGSSHRTFAGFIDEVMIHKRRLSAKEIHAACSLGAQARGTSVKPRAADAKREDPSVPPECGEEWPMYSGGPARSRCSAETLGFPLARSWEYNPAQPLRPAWPEPRKEQHRMDFDYAAHPVVVKGAVYVGSSADDTVRALDAASGQVRWRFVAGGPVRFAPAFWQDKVYAASDDGKLYCLRADTGALVWAFRSAPEPGMLLGNGRMISRWPLRSGVLVADGVAYVTAGMWPTHGTFVYALDAVTGKVLWCNDSSGDMFTDPPRPCPEFTGVAPQGYLLAGGGLLLVPTGRSEPALFDLQTGRLSHFQRRLDHHWNGGAWATVAGGVYFNPMQNRDPTQSDASLNVLPEESGPRKGDGMVAYSLREGSVGGLLFTLPGIHRVLVFRNSLYADDGRRVLCVDYARFLRTLNLAASTRWAYPHDSRVYSMAHCENALLLGTPGRVTALAPETGKEIWHADVRGQVRGLAIARDRLVVGDETGRVICFRPRSKATAAPRIVSERVDRDRETPRAEDARRILAGAGIRAGYCCVLGEDNPSLAYEIARQSDLHVINVRRGEKRPPALQEWLLSTGIYGSKLVDHGMASPDELPFSRYFADLVVVSGRARGLSGADLYRIVRPCGGVLYFHKAQRDEAARLIAEAGVSKQQVRTIAGDAAVVRGPLPAAGEWRHQWADGGNTGIGSERRVKPPFDLLWFGGPGPALMMDRHWGAAAPLSAAGRVFVAGRHHLLAFDAYNGRVLWTREFPGVGRARGIQNGSSIVADEASVFVALGATCYRVDQTTGAVLGEYLLPPREDTKSGGQADARVWGYVSVAGSVLLGTMCPAADKGVQPSGPGVMLFAYDKATGELRWSYLPQGAIPTVGIAHADGRVVLLDIPDSRRTGRAQRRGASAAVERKLVALALATGKTQWAQRDVPLPRLPQVQCTDRTVLVNGEAAYDLDSGKKIWARKNLMQYRDWQHANKNHALIHRDTVVLEPYFYSLENGSLRMTSDPLTGERTPMSIIRGGYACGGTTGCQNLLFFRSQSLGFFDIESKMAFNFGAIKPSCGVSVIAANGLAIVPEASSGCNCAYNFQTSFALAPSEKRRVLWSLCPGRASSQPIQNVRLNFGAPGDLRDEQGMVWLGYPRHRSARGVVRNVATLSSQDVHWYYRPPDRIAIEGTARPWLYSSGVVSPGSITVRLRSLPGIDLPRISKPDLDKMGRDASGVLGSGGVRLRIKGEAPAAVHLCHDSDNLYAFLVRKTKKRNGQTMAWSAKPAAHDSSLRNTDSWEIRLGDGRCDSYVTLGVSAAGVRYDSVYRYRTGKDDVSWKGDWDASVAVGEESWLTIVTVPWETLREVGVEKESLTLGLTATSVGRGDRTPHAKITVRRFSARWLGKLRAPHDGKYTMYVRRGPFDAIKLWLDGSLVLDTDTRGANTMESAQVALQAGRDYALRMDYVRGKTPSSDLGLQWASSKFRRRLIPSACLYDETGTAGGLPATYYNDEGFGKPAVQRIDPRIDFVWRNHPEVSTSHFPTYQDYTPRRDRFIPASFEHSEAPRKYTVRLHFAELEDIARGRRVFDITIQGASVLKGFDVLAAAGARKAAVIREFRGIEASQEVRVELRRLPGAPEDCRPPVLSAIEVCAE